MSFQRLRLDICTYLRMLNSEECYWVEWSYITDVPVTSKRYANMRFDRGYSRYSSKPHQSKKVQFQDENKPCSLLTIIYQLIRDIFL